MYILIKDKQIHRHLEDFTHVFVLQARKASLAGTTMLTTMRPQSWEMMLQLREPHLLHLKNTTNKVKLHLSKYYSIYVLK